MDSFPRLDSFPDISQTAVKFPDISGFSRQVATLCKEPSVGNSRVAKSAAEVSRRHHFQPFTAFVQFTAQ